MESEMPVILEANRRLGETRLLRMELRRRGAVVRMAATVEEARKEAGLCRPDLVIVDDDLSPEPAVDLVDLFHDAAPQAELIVLSSEAEPLTGGVGRGLLFQGRRPVSTETLLEVIDGAFPGRLTQGPRPPELAPMILCVDDEPGMLACLSRLLARHGYRVATFDDPQRVLDAIPEVAPDLMMLDVAMPGVDGRELAQRIRVRYRGLFPIVMHSALRTGSDRCSGFRHGADYYLPKPCEPHELFDVVDYYSDRLDPEERQYLEARL